MNDIVPQSGADNGVIGDILAEIEVPETQLPGNIVKIINEISSILGNTKDYTTEGLIKLIREKKCKNTEEAEKVFEEVNLRILKGFQRILKAVNSLVKTDSVDDVQIETYYELRTSVISSKKTLPSRNIRDFAGIDMDAYNNFGQLYITRGIYNRGERGIQAGGEVEKIVAIINDQGVGMDILVTVLNELLKLIYKLNGDFPRGKKEEIVNSYQITEEDINEKIISALGQLGNLDL